jgi:hypothetical protein
VRECEPESAEVGKGEKGRRRRKLEEGRREGGGGSSKRGRGKEGRRKRKLDIGICSLVNLFFGICRLFQRRCYRWPSPS